MRHPQRSENILVRISDGRRLWRNLISAHLPALVLGLGAILLAMGGTSFRLALRFQHDAIAHGQLWRLLTCHLVHAGWLHLSLDIAGLVLIWILVGSVYSCRVWWLLIFVISLSLSVCLYLLNPTLAWYVGLSGLLHGMLAAGALGQFKQRPAESSVIMIVLVAKLTWEQLYGSPDNLLGVPVIVDAHLYGSVTGAIAAALLLLNSYFHKRMQVR